MKTTARPRRAFYRVPLPASAPADLAERCAALLAAPEAWVERDRPRPRRINVRPYLDTLDGDGGRPGNGLWVTPVGTAKADEIARLVGLGDLVEAGVAAERIHLEIADEVDPDELARTPALPDALPAVDIGPAGPAAAEAAALGWGRPPTGRSSNDIARVGPATSPPTPLLRGEGSKPNTPSPAGEGPGGEVPPHPTTARIFMKKEMLINVLQPEECRIAILEDGVLEELYVERTSQESYVNNIYKGRIVNIEPSIQAAFVDFGIGRNGFLHVSDIDPVYYRHLTEGNGQPAGEEPPRGAGIAATGASAGAAAAGAATATAGRASSRSSSRPKSTSPVR